MKFRITSAEILQVSEDAEQNAGNYYVMLQVSEHSLFARKEHKVPVFCPQDVIPLWQQAIDANKLPEYMAHYVIVNDLPPFMAERSKIVQTSMTILVEEDSDGNPRQDARKIALQIISSMMKLVNGTTVIEAPKTYDAAIDVFADPIVIETAPITPIETAPIAPVTPIVPVTATPAAATL